MQKKLPCKVASTEYGESLSNVLLTSISPDKLQTECQHITNHHPAKTHQQIVHHLGCPPIIFFSQVHGSEVSSLGSSPASPSCQSCQRSRKACQSQAKKSPFFNRIQHLHKTTWVLHVFFFFPTSFANMVFSAS